MTLSLSRRRLSQVYPRSSGLRVGGDLITLNMRLLLGWWFLDDNVGMRLDDPFLRRGRVSFRRRRRCRGRCGLDRMGSPRSDGCTQI